MVLIRTWGNPGQQEAQEFLTPAQLGAVLGFLVDGGDGTVTLTDAAGNQIAKFSGPAASKNFGAAIGDYGILDGQLLIRQRKGYAIHINGGPDTVDYDPQTGEVVSSRAVALMMSRCSDTQPPLLIFHRYRGDIDAPLKVHTGDRIFAISGLFSHSDGNTPPDGYTSTIAGAVAINGRVTETLVQAGRYGGAIDIFTTAIGASSVGAATATFDASIGFGMFGGNVVIDTNRHQRLREYTRATLPTPSASNKGMAAVTNPESGKAPQVYNNGTTWTYPDSTAVTIS